MRDRTKVTRLEILLGGSNVFDPTLLSFWAL